MEQPVAKWPLLPVMAFMTLTSHGATADDASEFFNKYNSQDSNIRMECPDTDNKTILLFTAKDGNLFLNGSQAAQVKQNGKKQQFYITGIGLSLVEVATISGHKDPKMLFRYTHLKAEEIAAKLQRLD